MKTSSRIMIAVTACLSAGAALLMAGCASTYQTRGDAEPSAFLGDTSQLHEGEEGEAKLVYVNPKADFRTYKKILLDPVKIMAEGATESTFTAMSQEQQQAMVDYVDAMVREKLKADYAFLTQPGPDVMRLRICITEAKGANVVLDTISTIVPQALALSTLKRVVLGTYSGVGKAGVEMELQDAVSGERLAAAVDERAGEKITLKGDKFERYRTFDDAFDYWTTRLQQRLAELRARPVAP